MSRLWGTTALFATLMMAAMPMASAQEGTTTPQQITIAAGDLRGALDQLADQFGLQLIVQGDLSGMSSGDVSATLDARDALQLLLTGTGYQFEFITDDSVRIAPASSGALENGGTTVLPEVVVSATRSRRSIKSP